MDFLLDSNVIIDFIGKRLPVPATLEYIDFYRLTHLIQ